MGPDMQAMKELYVAENEALSRLVLPEGLRKQNPYVLHPSLMAGALGTEIAIYSEKEQDNLYLPFSADSVEIYDKLPDECYVYTIRNKTASSEIRKGELYLLDKHGVILAQIVKIYNRKIDGGNKEKAVTTTNKPVYYTFEWEEDTRQRVYKNELFTVFTGDNEKLSRLFRKNPMAVVISDGKEFLEAGRKEYIINYEQPEDYKELFQTLRDKKIPYNNILYVAGYKETEDASKENEKYGLYGLFHITKTLEELNIRDKIKLVYGFYESKNQIQPYYAQADGFLRSAGWEIPNMKSIHVSCGKEEKLEELEKMLLLEFTENTEKEVRLEGKRRFIRKMVERKPEKAADRRIKENGVYIISGGAGGLGSIFAQEFAGNCPVKLILLGSSEMNENKRNLIKELKEQGSEAVYIKTDLTDRQQVEETVERLKNRFGQINGVIHAAGIIKDAYLKSKSLDELKQVMAPKVRGAVYLDEALKNEELDFFVLFSSATGVFGNFGQTDYAAANSFLDTFSFSRNELVKQGKRFGQTLSLGWPLWKDGGMKVEKQSVELMEKISGMQRMEKEDGLQVFRDWIGQNECYILVMSGKQKKIQDALHMKKAPVHTQKKKGVQSGMLLHEIKEKLLKELGSMVTEITGVKKEKLELDADINNFGFDSVMLTDFGNQINKKYGVEVTPAVFFEFNTLNTIAGHLAEEYTQIFAQHFGVQSLEINMETQDEESEETKNSEVTAEIFTVDEDIRAEENGSYMPDYDDIAIIGASGIFPGADNLEEYWSVLEQEKNCVTEIPETRFDWKKYYREKPSLEGNDIITKYGGFIPDMDCFDAEFMGISPKEAELMDPQQRKLLETVWHTLEDAGYNPDNFVDSDTGVFIGVEGVDYTLMDSINGVVSQAHPYSSTGIGMSLAANRISYVYNLHGPSEVISTACSSSLTTVDAAIKAIHNGDCDMALAGGVSAILTPYFYSLLSKLGVLSPGAKCRTFDKDADGYVRGEGVGTILLKPLKKAVRDKDNIYAVIKATAVNHGGKANSITSPNVNMERMLLEKAYKRAGVTPDTITYIEAHGTGTRIGDHIEVDAMKRAFSNLYDYYGITQTKENYCGLGSVKTNIGHLEPAASVASIIKVILSMRNKVLPGTVNFKELNPYIQLEGSPFYIVDKTRKWECLKDEEGNEIPRRAGISGFGYGGAYAHIVLEEYRTPVLKEEEQKEHIIVLSGRNPERLHQNAENLAAYLKKQQKQSEVKEEKKNVKEELDGFLTAHLAQITGLKPEEFHVSMNLLEQGAETFALNQLFDKINTLFGITLNVNDILPEVSLTKIRDVLIEKAEEPINRYFQSGNKKEENRQSDIRIEI